MHPWPGTACAPARAPAAAQFLKPDTLEERQQHAEAGFSATGLWSTSSPHLLVVGQCPQALNVVEAGPAAAALVRAGLRHRQGRPHLQVGVNTEPAAAGGGEQAQRREEAAVSAETGARLSWQQEHSYVRCASSTCTAPARTTVPATCRGACSRNVRVSVVSGSNAGSSNAASP